MSPPLCRFGDRPAIARYALSDGCVCYPDDREQDLCVQHILRATPLGTMKKLVVYDEARMHWVEEPIS